MTELWSPIHDAVVFLDKMQSYEPLPSSHITLLGAVYGVATTTNGELRYRFYILALREVKSTAAKIFATEAANWVTGRDGSGIIQGRMKFCRPVFRAIAKVDKALARRAFDKDKSAFHPIARKLIDGVSDIHSTPAGGPIANLHGSQDISSMP
jgi:leukotriene-A4 hydrolase